MPAQASGLGKPAKNTKALKGRPKPFTSNRLHLFANLPGHTVVCFSQIGELLSEICVNLRHLRTNLGLCSPPRPFEVRRFVSTHLRSPLWGFVFFVVGIGVVGMVRRFPNCQ